MHDTPVALNVNGQRSREWETDEAAERIRQMRKARLFSLHLAPVPQPNSVGRREATAFRGSFSKSSLTFFSHRRRHKDELYSVSPYVAKRLESLFTMNK